MYKDLFLGIRQYDCNLTQDTFKRLIDIAYNSQFDNEYPGYQTSFFDLDDISLDLLKNTFIECCRDYYKITRKDIVRLWYYQDWKYNPHDDGCYWHDHSYNFYGLSGILYLSLPDDSTTTGFSLSADKSVTGSYSGFDDMLSLPPIIQKWFIFPSTIPHLPGKCMSEKRRICVGADYWYA